MTNGTCATPQEAGANAPFASVQAVDDVLSSTINVVRADSCSAVHCATATRMFEHACDASLHPIGPLYNHVQKRLRCRAIRAFSRIFDLADEDADGALSDAELKKFHLFAFGRVLDDQELHSTQQVPTRSMTY
jgi:mitochondrial Rho GTPase 1